MQHFPKTKTKSTSEDDADAPAPEITPPRMLDRADQRMTRLIGAMFSISSFLCLVAVSVLGIFFVTIIAQGGEIGLLPIFSALGVSLVLGMLLLDFAHARALAGYRAAREQNARLSKAFAGGVLCLLLGMIHPLMAIAIPISAGIGVLGHVLVHRFSTNEPMWDFLPKEAIAVLSGRDRIGLEMAATRPRSHVMASPVSQAGTAIAVISSLATGSYLVAANIMNIAAFIPLIFGSVWCVQTIVEYAEGRFSNRDTSSIPASKVEWIEGEQTEDEYLGLNVQNLTVRNSRGHMMLTDVNVNVEPGRITGIVGPSGAGKSLLLQAIADPFSISNAEVSGQVHIGRTDLWVRQNNDQTVPTVLLPPQPIMLPSSGADNLSCFHDGEMLNRGKWFLERLVFAVDMVESICDAPDAQTLPSMQIKTLALSRAFMLAPSLYLMDKPEDSLPDKQIAALVHRLNQEARLGRSVLMITNNRALLECCDRLIVMHEGRITDFGPANDVSSRMDSGWSRLIGKRHPDTEEVLINWVRSHFYRDGDEMNRRKVAAIASDMLALSYQSSNSRQPGEIQFLFKHFEGHCLLRMTDNDPPLGAGAIHKAEQEAESDVETHKLSLLGSIIRNAQKIECDTKQDHRRLTVQIETYDPRKTGRAVNAK